MPDTERQLAESRTMVIHQSERIESLEKRLRDATARYLTAEANAKLHAELFERLMDRLMKRVERDY